MSMYSMLRGEALDYAHSNIKVNLGQLIISPSGGKVWYPNNTGSFTCTIANTGLMLISNFIIHVYTNEYGQLRASYTTPSSNWTSELKLGPITIKPHDVVHLPIVKFKALRKTDGFRDVVFANIESFDLSWYQPLNSCLVESLETNEKLALQIQEV